MHSTDSSGSGKEKRAGNSSFQPFFIKSAKGILSFPNPRTLGRGSEGSLPLFLRAACISDMMSSSRAWRFPPRVKLCLAWISKTFSGENISGYSLSDGDFARCCNSFIMQSDSRREASFLLHFEQNMRWNRHSSPATGERSPLRYWSNRTSE